MGRLLSLVDNTAMADQQCELDVESVVCDDWRRTTTVARYRLQGCGETNQPDPGRAAPEGPKKPRASSRRTSGQPRWPPVASKSVCCTNGVCPHIFGHQRRRIQRRVGREAGVRRRRLVDLAPQRNLDLELFRNGLDGKPGTVQRLVEAPRGRRDAHFAGASVGHDPWQSVRHVLRRGGELFGTPVVDSYGPPRVAVGSRTAWRTPNLLPAG